MKKLVMVEEISTQGKLNIRIVASAANKQVAAPDGFGETFTSIPLSNGNNAYAFKADFPSAPKPGMYNAEYVRLPLPEGFCTKKSGSIINSGESTVLPLLIYLNTGEAPASPFVHKCDSLPHPEDRGTQCATLLQSRSNVFTETAPDNVVYFSSKDVPIPYVKKNEFLNGIIRKFNKKSKGKTVYYLPTLTSNSAIIYVVARGKKGRNRIKKLIEQASSAPSGEYIIALNGFIIDVDDWNCPILLDGNDVKVNGTKIKSLAEVAQ